MKEALPLRRYRFSLLFLSLLLMTILQPIVQSTWGDRFLTGTSILILVSTIYSVCKRRWEMVMASCLVLPLLAIVVLGLEIVSSDLGIVVISIYMLFFLYAIFQMLRHIMSEEVITVETIFAALSVYLILGYIWAMGYVLIDLHGPGAFQMGDQILTLHGMQAADNLSHFIYYSFVTLSTLGYGDVRPITQGAQMLSAFEAVCGQLFLVVLVARLVGLKISQGRNS